MSGGASGWRRIEKRKNEGEDDGLRCAMIGNAEMSCTFVGTKISHLTYLRPALIMLSRFP